MFWTRKRSEPFYTTMSRHFDLFDRFSQRSRQEQGARVFPPFNIWADDTAAILTSEIPGVDMDSIEITVAGKDVDVKGVRKDENGEGGKVVRRERGHGEFERAFQLPFQIDAGKVEAKLVNGVLEIVLPRAENDKPRKIAIVEG